MKPTTRTFALILGLLAFVACKDTECIYQDERLCDPNYNGNVYEGVVEFNENLNGYSEKMVLEEFTGFKCTNCPDATAEAKRLVGVYNPRLLLVAIHCTPFFAAPSPNTQPGDPFYKDFRTVEGEEYYNFYQPPGLPDGMINRLGTENTPTISDSQWAGRLEQLMADNNPEVFIKIQEISVAPDSASITVLAMVKPLVLDNDRFNINLAITENGIEEAQKDVGNVTLYDYIHDHVFRGNSNGNWGTFAYDGNVDLASNEALQFKLTVNTKPEWVLANCNAVVYISRESNRAIVQAEEAHLIP